MLRICYVLLHISNLRPDLILPFRNPIDPGFVSCPYFSARSRRLVFFFGIRSIMVLTSWFVVAFEIPHFEPSKVRQHGWSPGQVQGVRDLQSPQGHGECSLVVVGGVLDLMTD
jgi:hypothetical protein